MPYQLIRDAVSRDTVEALEQLLVAAQEGQIVGLAFAAALKNRRYVTNVAGTLYRDATLARGMVATLDDELSAIVQGRTDDETR
jgi:hypothetical protein